VFLEWQIADINDLGRVGSRVGGVKLRQNRNGRVRPLGLQQAVLGPSGEGRDFTRKEAEGLRAVAHGAQMPFLASLLNMALDEANNEKESRRLAGHQPSVSDMSCPPCRCSLPPRSSPGRTIRTLPPGGRWL
jgi:hypothetical protein